MIQKALLGFLIAFVSITSSSAQEVKEWSLLECINYAHENNITVKRQLLNAEYQENVLKQSKLDRLPNLNAGIDGTFNYGYTWIQQIPANVEEPVLSLRPSISSNVSVFRGLEQKNTIERNKYNLKSALEQTEKAKNDIALQITAQYMQILFDKELLAVAKEQYETSKLQVDRTQKLVDAGSVALGNLLEIKSQAAKEALNVTQQNNNLRISLLNLTQLLDLEDPLNFEIQSPVLPELEMAKIESPSNIFNTALEIMPQIKSSEYNLTSQEYELKMSKGSFYPTLGVGAGFGASAASYLGDAKEYNTPIFDQFGETRSLYLGLSLNIPIFNRLQSRNSVANAKLNVLDAQYQLKAEKLQLRKDIQQAYADAIASHDKYLSSQDAVKSYQESFRYTEKKFNVGLVNSVDYNVAKTDFTRAQSDLLQAKYEYILRTKILDFYKGIPIEL